jgi:hypothetical protein
MPICGFPNRARSLFTASSITGQAPILGSPV